MQCTTNFPKFVDSCGRFMSEAHQETYDLMAYGYKGVHTENQLLS